MSSRRASDLFVECLEVEGVKYVFGIPGEETLDLNESLHDSSIDFIPVRHEQGGAYMADMYGRGFLMNVQELETAMRLKTPIVNVIWENAQFGSIVWKQDKKFGRHFGTDFTNPDFVKLADAFGMPAWRCESVEDFGRHLRHALSLELPSLIVVPIDYSLDVSISEELGTETVAA